MTKVLMFEHPSGEKSYIDADSNITNYWPHLPHSIVDRCGFDVSAGWGPWRCGNEEPCLEHQRVFCECGKRATHLCSFASQFVCGKPVCDSHSLCRYHSYGTCSSTV